MKCIHCGRDSRYRERELNGTCPGCGRRFAYEPQRDPLKITDTFFYRVIESVSSNGKLYFTEQQLWYEFNRRLAGRRWWTRPLSIGAASFMFALCLWGSWGAWSLAIPVVITVAAGLAGYLNHRKTLRQPSVALQTFRQQYLQAWTTAHGGIVKLLPAVNPHFSGPSGPEPDLTAYSFDRAVVTEHFSLAAMLVANNFHFEHNCAILSLDGFPAGIKDTILTMLRRNPGLTVYTLHDASASGCSLPIALRHPAWFPDRTTTVFDLGLRPRHVIGKPWMVVTGIPPALTDEVRQLLTTTEAEWLQAGNVVELAALRPGALMRAVYRGIGRAVQAAATAKQDEKEGGDGGDVIWIHGSGPASDKGQSGEANDDIETGDFDDGGADGGDSEAADSFG